MVEIYRNSLAKQPKTKPDGSEGSINGQASVEIKAENNVVAQVLEQQPRVNIKEHHASTVNRIGALKGFKCPICIEDFSPQKLRQMTEARVKERQKETEMIKNDVKEIQIDQAQLVTEKTNKESVVQNEKYITQKENDIDQDPEALQIVLLRPCSHIMCSQCFFEFSHKIQSDKCLSCTQNISSYIVLTYKPVDPAEEAFQKQEAEKEGCLTVDASQASDSAVELLDFAMSSEMDFIELLSDVIKGKNSIGVAVQSEADLVADCLDHSYFLIELKNLLNLHKRAEAQLVETRGWRQTGRQVTEIELAALGEIKARASEMKRECELYIQFDANQRVKEIYEMSEMLFKLESGKFTAEMGGQNYAEMSIQDKKEQFVLNLDQNFEIVDQGQKKGKRKGGRRGKR